MAAIIFPPHPNDGDQVIDMNGQVFEYDTQSNSWIHTATDSNNTIVNSTNKGIITPDLTTQLNSLESVSPLKGLKFRPNLNAYWYLLQSRFNYLDFNVRNNIVQIEVNSTKLIRALSSRACPGVKGTTGSDGSSGGNSGKPGPIEEICQPIEGSDPNILGVEVEVQTPLDTSISLRFFENSTQLVEIKLDIDGKTTIIDDTINTSIESLEYDSTSEMLSGEILAVWPENVNYKARQVGSSGTQGNDGKNFIIIRDHFVSDPNAFADSAITTMRANSQSGLLFARADLTQTTSAASLRGTNSGTNIFITTPSIVAIISSPIPDLWAAVEPTVSEHKDLFNWGFSGCVDSATGQPVVCDTPQIDFPSWNPQAVCHHNMPNDDGVDHTTYDYSSFEWWGQDGPPFDLVLEAKPDKLCCQEDAFYCTEDVSNCKGSAPRPLIVDNL